MIARQSTARTFMIGPVLDADGVAVTDGVIADVKVSKNGGVPAALDGSATLTHRHTGHYSLAATANDFDTVGTAQFALDDTVNACPPVNFQVVEEAVYDALYAASASAWSGAAGSSIGKADVTQWGSVAIETPTVAGVPNVNAEYGDGQPLSVSVAADKKLIAEGVIGATGNDSTHLHLTGLTYGDDDLNDYEIRVYDNSAGKYHTAYITDWVLSTALATVETLPFTPEASVDSYTISGPKRTAPAVVVGTVDTGATSTVLPTSALAPAAVSTNQFAGRIVIFDNDTATAGLRGQGARIASSTTGGQITLETADALSSAPAFGDRFRIF